MPHSTIGVDFGEVRKYSGYR